MAPIGTITTGLKLERTQFHGADPIAGTISLGFQSETAHHELFGPLHLRVILQGYLKLHVSENRTSHAYIFFNENLRLVRKTQDVLTGKPLRISTGKTEIFSFQTRFPDAVDIGIWSRSRKGESLPPSFKTRFEAAAVRQFGKHQGAARIEYSLRVEVVLPGIDVDVVNETTTIIQYEPAKVPYHDFSRMSAVRDISQTLQVETYQLLPEDRRPTSLVGKTKAVLSNVPKPVFAFTATCVRVPEAFALGQAIHFDVRVQRDDKTTGATIVPEILILNGKMDIVARTELYATNEKGVDSPRLGNSIVVHTLKMTKPSAGAGTFSKSNDYTQSLAFDALPLDTPSSFSLTKLSRSYQAQLELEFVVAGTAMQKTVVMRRLLVLRVLPPALTSPAPPYTTSIGESSGAGSSRHRIGTTARNELEELPLYEEAVGLVKVS